MGASTCHPNSWEEDRALKAILSDKASPDLYKTLSQKDETIMMMMITMG